MIVAVGENPRKIELRCPRYLFAALPLYLRKSYAFPVTPLNSRGYAAAHVECFKSQETIPHTT